MSDITNLKLIYKDLVLYLDSNTLPPEIYDELSKAETILLDALKDLKIIKE